VNQRQTNGVATALSSCVVNEEWIGRTAVVSVSGVLDMLTSPQLEAAIAGATSKDPAAVVVDLSDVEFLASAGMGVLVAARDKAYGKYGFAVVASGPATSRPLKLVGLADVVGLYSTLAEARGAVEA
jgi:anti-sigma B factor antagonist